jgi:hypothetical protein
MMEAQSTLEMIAELRGVVKAREFSPDWQINLSPAELGRLLDSRDELLRLLLSTRDRLERYQETDETNARHAYARLEGGLWRAGIIRTLTMRRSE